MCIFLSLVLFSYGSVAAAVPSPYCTTGSVGRFSSTTTTVHRAKIDPAAPPPALSYHLTGKYSLAAWSHVDPTGPDAETPTQTCNANIIRHRRSRRVRDAGPARDPGLIPSLFLPGDKPLPGSPPPKQRSRRGRQSPVGARSPTASPGARIAAVTVLPSEGVRCAR